MRRLFTAALVAPRPSDFLDAYYLLIRMFTIESQAQQKPLPRAKAWDFLKKYQGPSRLEPYCAKPPIRFCQKKLTFPSGVFTVPS
jgi:hypothetical protein